jgi:polar amino acid transport system substrate-binding protein
VGNVRAVEAKTEVPLIKDVGTPQKKLSPFIYFGLLPFLLLIVAMLFAGLADATVNAATDSPEVRVGSELEFPPYAFVDKSGQPAGFSVDLIKAVAAVMGLSIKISTGPWDTVW